MTDKNTALKIMRLSHWQRVYDAVGNLVSETAHAWGEVCEGVDGDEFIPLDVHDRLVAEAVAAALTEVLAFRAQVAHGSVNLTSLGLTMNRAETALQEKTDDQ